VRGMGGWEPTDLERETYGEVLDFSTETELKETNVPDEKKTEDGDQKTGSDRVTLDLSREDYTTLTGFLDDLRAAQKFTAGRGPGGDGSTGAVASAGATDLDRGDDGGNNTLDLMRAEIATERQARLDLERDLRESRAERELDTLKRAGLAPALIDLARPLVALGLGGESVIDLDRGGKTEKVDAGKVVRDLLQAFVDLSRQGVAVIDLDLEQGFYTETDEDRARDRAMAEAFDRQFPIN